MDYNSLSKRRLFSAIGWVIVGLWAIFNVAITFSGVPPQAAIIIVPIVNVVLIAIWFFVRTLYNIANSKLKHDSKMELYEEPKPIPTYSEDDAEVYIPNITVDTELFKSITTDPSKSVSLDVSLSDYLKPGRVIIFHDEIDYGLRKEVKVSKATTKDDGIEAFFTKAQDGGES